MFRYQRFVSRAVRAESFKLTLNKELGKTSSILPSKHLNWSVKLSMFCYPGFSTLHPFQELVIFILIRLIFSRSTMNVFKCLLSLYDQVVYKKELSIVINTLTTYVFISLLLSIYLSNKYLSSMFTVITFHYWICPVWCHQFDNEYIRQASADKTLYELITRRDERYNLWFKQTSSI